ncbi:hypothetical protein ACTFIW_005493 [Dictyostelium discoideum]
MTQEESQLDWIAYSRILQCKSRPPQPPFRDESQIIIQSNQELRLSTKEGSVQSNPTSVRSNTDRYVRISHEPSFEQLLNNLMSSILKKINSSIFTKHYQVLYQIQGRKFKAIWFHSKKLTDTQKGYSIGERKFLSIIDYLKKFQHLLIGNKVSIYNDHQNLTYIINKSNDKPFTKRQNNYIKYRKEFDYELRHISGKKNGMPTFINWRQDNYIKYRKEFNYELRHISGKKNGIVDSYLRWKRFQIYSLKRINDICYLSEDGFKKLIIIDKETIHDRHQRISGYQIQWSSFIRYHIQ